MYCLAVLFSLTTASMETSPRVDTSITYIHDRPASFKSRLLQTLMGALGKKNRIENNFKRNKFPSEAAALPPRLQKDFDVLVDEINQRKCWTLTPRKNRSKKLVVYIHGGGYVANITKYDWDLIHELLIETGCTIVVPDYPLAPAANYKDVYDYFDKLYSKLTAEALNLEIIFMGNSAGGGIALGFAQKLRAEGKRQPAQLILISPWLDVSLSNPGILQLDKKDKLLGIRGLQLAAQSYAAGLPLSDYKLSPVYGDLSGLGQISLFIGTHDLFLADSRKLKERLKEQHIPINYFEYPKMFHVWVAVTSLKESQHAIKQIVQLINRGY